MTTETYTMDGHRIRGVVMYEPDSGLGPAFPTSICVLPDGRWYGVVAWQGVPTVGGRMLTSLQESAVESLYLRLLPFGGPPQLVGVVERIERSAVFDNGRAAVFAIGTSEGLEPGVYGASVETEAP